MGVHGVRAVKLGGWEKHPAWNLKSTLFSKAHKQLALARQTKTILNLNLKEQDGSGALQKLSILDQFQKILQNFLEQVVDSFSLVGYIFMKNKLLIEQWRPD